EHCYAIGEFGGMMIGQQETARPEADVLGLQKGLREDEIGCRMRLPRRRVMFADPGFLITELVEPAQTLKIPVLALLQSTLRRMRGHRKISEFHGFPLAACFCSAVHASLRAKQSLARCRLTIMGWRLACPTALCAKLATSVAVMCA